MKRIITLIIIICFVAFSTSCEGNNNDSTISGNSGSHNSESNNSDVSDTDESEDISSMPQIFAFNDIAYFNSFENFASTVGVKGVYELIGVRYDDHLQYKGKEIEERIKVAEKNLPQYTYYPYYDGLETDLNGDFEGSMSVETVGQAPLTRNYSNVRYCASFPNFQTIVDSRVWIDVKMANNSCENPRKVIGWNELVEGSTASHDKCKIILDEYGWESLIEYSELREYDGVYFDAITKDGQYPCILNLGGFGIVFNFLLEDNVLFKLYLEKTSESRKDGSWKNLVIDLDWLKNLSFKRIDFEYHKYTEVVDYDENLDTINHSYMY